jgi:hypothetical protein
MLGAISGLAFAWFTFTGHWWSSVWSLGTGVSFAVGGFLFNWRQRIQDSQVYHRLPRAELQIGKSTVSFRPNCRIDISIRLTNHGELTAKNLVTRGLIIARLASENPIGVDESSLLQSDMPAQLTPNAVKDVILQGQLQAAVSTLAIQRGWFQLFYYGVANYEDEADQKHSLEICLRYLPDYPDMTIAERKYWPVSVRPQK